MRQIFPVYFKNLSCPQKKITKKRLLSAHQQHYSTKN